MKERKNIIVEDWQWGWLPKNKSKAVRYALNNLIMLLRGKRLRLDEKNITKKELENQEYKARKLAERKR